MMLNEGRSDGGDVVLEPATVAQMSINAMGALTVPPLKTAMPSLANDSEFFPGIEKQWGLSFMINNAEAPTGRSPGGLAWAGLANTFYWIDQRQGIGGVYATQILPFADGKSFPLYLAFECLAYGR
jgi:CubicO group peptidase (beta-lactamase class C family)